MATVPNPEQLAFIAELLNEEYEATGSYAQNRGLYAQALFAVADVLDKTAKFLIEDTHASFDWATPENTEILQAGQVALTNVIKHLLIGATVERGGKVAISDAGKLLLTPNITDAITVPTRDHRHVDFG